MSRNFNQIVIATSTFGDWLELSNKMANAYANVVTTAANSAGDTTTGNAFVAGVFGSTILTANASVRGGNVDVAANLNIISNVYVVASNSAFECNVYVNAANAAFNTNTFSINGLGGGNAVTISTNSSITNSIFISHYLNITGNTRVTNTASFSNSVSITGALNTANLQSFVTATNAILSTSGANTVTHGSSGDVLVDSFSGSTYRGGKYTISVKDVGGSTYQMTELLLMHDGSTGYTTEYATLRSSATNLAVFSANVDGTTVRLYSNSQVSSSVYKLDRTLIAV